MLLASHPKGFCPVPAVSHQAALVMSASGGGVWLLPPQLLLSLLYICSHLRLLCTGLFLAGRSTESPGLRFGGWGVASCPRTPSKPFLRLSFHFGSFQHPFLLISAGPGIRLTSTFDRLAREGPAKLVPQRSPRSYKESD